MYGFIVTTLWVVLLYPLQTVINKKSKSKLSWVLKRQHGIFYRTVRMPNERQSGNLV